MDGGVRVHVVHEKDRTCFSMRYRDPISGKHVKRSAGTSNRKEAERRAHQWEAEINAGRYKSPNRIAWDEFRKRCEEEKLADPSISQATREAYSAAFNHLERVLDPDKLCKLTSETMSRFVRELRRSQEATDRNGKKTLLPPMRESTIACHLRHLKAAMNWAVKMGLLVESPRIDMPKAGEAKGRPLVVEEFERMLQAVSKVRPHDPGVWTRYLYGLWLSGIRLQESLVLSWDLDAPFAVDLSGKFPSFKIEAKAQKGRRSERVPMTPDFAEWLLQTPDEDRTGPVFKLLSLLDGEPLMPKRVSRIISKIGEKSGVVVNNEEEKYASAHDLRRSFGTRWAKRLMPAVLQRLMRHTSIHTTMTYYVNLEADEMAAELWRGFHRQEGTILGTIAQEETENTAMGPDGASSEPPCGDPSYASGGHGSRTHNGLRRT